MQNNDTWFFSEDKQKFIKNKRAWSRGLLDKKTIPLVTKLKHNAYWIRGFIVEEVDK